MPEKPPPSPAPASTGSDWVLVRRLFGLASDETLQAYEDVFHRADPSAYPALMQAATH